MTRRAAVPFWLFALNLALTCAVCALGLWIWSLPIHQLPRAQLDALQRIHRQIVTQHVVPPPDDDLMWAAIEGMVASTDRFSEFVRPSNVEEFDGLTKGTYAGIGVLMGFDDGQLLVRFPFEGGPSEEQDVRVGDRILQIDGEDIRAETSQELFANAKDRLMGPVGTTVRVLVQRGDEQPFEVEIERRDVHLPSVKWPQLVDPERGIGYAYVKTFQEGTASELFATLDDLDAQSPVGLKGLILDFRYNRGGLLDEAVAIVNHFVPEGTIVSLERRNDDNEVHEADPAKCRRPASQLALVLLVDEDSASASEVVTGALRDHERARVVGRQTWGKGLVQSIFSWQGLDFRLKLTTARYKTPNGEYFMRENEQPGGIEPHVEVALGNEARAHVLDLLFGTQDPPKRYRELVQAQYEELGQIMPQPYGPDTDVQLAAAIEQVRASVDGTR